ncbi:peptidoglycan endopeptidase, partial [Salmonella enterica subsp. enterica]|nr:peptidoglycan endopeptidase [Salmonella enterica subsp. enterica serovar Paratyphi A]
LDTQLLQGDPVSVFDRANGFAWVQDLTDGYVGYVDELALTETPLAATHTVTAPRTFVYPGPDMKLPVLRALSMGTNVQVSGETETRGTRYLVLADGTAMIARHLKPITQADADYVTTAETLLNTPYLWGGTSGFGIDCSGLVQLAMRMAGRNVLRDTSMQETTVGEPLDPGPDFSGARRGDLVFWKGHVAIMTDPAKMIHANGHTMQVSHESLADAVKRIGYLYGQPTSFRRP